MSNLNTDPLDPEEIQELFRQENAKYRAAQDAKYRAQAEGSTTQTLGDSLYVVRAARDVLRCRIVSIIRKRSDAHRAKKGNILAALIADELDEVVRQITAATKVGEIK